VFIALEVVQADFQVALALEVFIWECCRLSSEVSAGECQLEETWLNFGCF